MVDKEVQQIRQDFPLIAQDEMVYLDNAATMQKPRAVIDAVREFYEKENASTLRGLYDLSAKATMKVEQVRQKVADFMGVESKEIIFTKNATDGINMVALMVGSALSEHDEVVVGLDGHHSNILPWMDLERRSGVKLKLIQPEKNGDVKVQDFKDLVNSQTAIVATTLMSNVTGKTVEVEKVGALSAQSDSHMLMVVDAAQAVAHMPVYPTLLKAAFMVWSGHKIGAPMGVGVLTGKAEILRQFLPAFYGGEMVDEVAVKNKRLNLELAESPHRFEAGTQNVEGIIGLGVAIDYWREHDENKLFNYIDELTFYAGEQLKDVPDLELVACEHGIISFNINGVHPHDVAQILAAENICVRAGYHCAQPLLDQMGIGPCVRASLTFYNTRTEIDKLVGELRLIRKKMGL